MYTVCKASTQTSTGYRGSSTLQCRSPVGRSSVGAGFAAYGPVPGARPTSWVAPAPAPRDAPGLAPRRPLGGPSSTSGPVLASGPAAARGRAGEPENPVVALLAKADLLQYAEALLLDGFTDLATLADLSEEDMQELGMRRGHMIRLRKGLQEVSSRPTKPARCGGLDIAPEQSIDLQPTGKQLTLVQMSWERLKVVGEDKVGGVLCEQFFKSDAEMKKYFPEDVRKKYQTWTFDEANVGSDLRDSHALRALFGKKLAVVGYFIAGLSKKNMLPRVKQMGHRHFQYGGGRLGEEHFEKLERALLATLRKVLGEHFTSDIEVAWAMVFQFVAGIMQCGCREALAIKEKAEEEARRKAKLALELAGVDAAPPSPTASVVTQAGSVYPSSGSSTAETLASD